MKVFRVMTVRDIAIELQQGYRAKDLSRVRLRICEDGLSGTAGHTHTTKHYATIHGNSLQWQQSFSFRYTRQSKLAFQTYCEHEFGYQLQQLKVLFQGQYTIQNEMFFQKDTTPVFTPEGRKAGMLKWEVRVENREESQKQEEGSQVEAPKPVRPDLIGLIKIEELSLGAVNPLFKREKYKTLQATIRFGEQEWTRSSPDGRWTFPQLKLEYISEGTHTISFVISHQGRQLMEGQAECATMERLKRYTKLKIPLINRNGVRVCQLVLEYRFMEKKEVLDLRYSPDNRLSFELPRANSTGAVLTKKQRQGSFLSPRGKSTRYQIGYLLNRNCDVFLPKAPRFPPSPPASPLSYIDPQHCSDFSGGRRGWGIGIGGKWDCTRQFRGNPGVGAYELPSIWSKY